MSQHNHESKSSGLLTKDENEQVFSLLGNRCQSLATTVIQLFTTHPPHHLEWVKKDTGILCFVKDNVRKNYFFRLYCLKRNGMVWEQEMYENMEYIAACPFFHTFEGEDCIIAFNFANNLEAQELKAMVESRIQSKRRRLEEKRLRNLTQENHDQPRLPTNNDLMFYKKSSDPAERKAKRKRNITKADIGNPSEFRHVSHVGWDPDKGFDIAGNDPHLTEFFRKAGVSEKHLKDKDTREFIYDFINSHGGRAALQEEVQASREPPVIAPPSTGPPVPPRGAPRTPHSRAAPPPPPLSSQQPPRPPPTLRNTSQANNLNAAVSPSVAVPPPPPPPPPPPVEVTSPVPPPMPSLPSQPDPRSALMESIREGTTLKPIDQERKPIEDNSRDARGDLMSEIRKGFQLKPASEREVKPASVAVEEKSTGDLAGALARALAERSRVIHSEDDSTSDTDSNDDDWDA